MSFSIYGIGLNILCDQINNKLRIHISMKKGGLSIRNLKKIFDSFDINQNGKLSISELIKGLN